MSTARKADLSRSLSQKSIHLQLSPQKKNFTERLIAQSGRNMYSPLKERLIKVGVPE
jgi:hypothetical protein